MRSSAANQKACCCLYTRPRGLRVESEPNAPKWGIFADLGLLKQSLSVFEQLLIQSHDTIDRVTLDDDIVID